MAADRSNVIGKEMLQLDISFRGKTEHITIYHGDDPLSVAQVGLLLLFCKESL